ncbi:MAG: AAA family ATPase [Treponema sp.]|jgi:putative ATPase|nr:AAA family ATPase [Treponema sp.]
MSDLFSLSAGNSKDSSNPLADRMRPRELDDIIGQDHIVGPGRLLRRAIQADRLSSLIFYGPPGTGKTSLAHVIANTTRASFESLNAVLSGIKDIREAIDRADEKLRLYGKRTILFVDEVHRWNKAQQDALLPWVENGTVILIGATTENPFFEVNRALVSRSRIFQLKALTAEDLLETAKRAVSDRERGYGRWKLTFEEGALEHLVEVAGGDARSLLNALELAIETSGGKWPPPEDTEIKISFEAAEESIQRRAVLYDRDGDYHFDTISAFIKSVRGSDPDAALYWLAKMVRAGEDPSFIFRRMIILASEDVGLADPHALEVVISCAESFDRIGFPEGNFPLAHACLYLATAPKSNTTLAFFDALKEVDREDAEVPNQLRDASRDAEGFGHGEGYIYPHAYRDHWAAQQYLPTVLQGRTFYSPSRVGYEGKIREEVLRKREIQAAVILGHEGNAAAGESLSWSASSRGREGWFKRLESGRSALLLKNRNSILEQCGPARHHRILIAAANDGLLLWESLRRCPEGLCAALVDTGAAREALLRFASALDEDEQPQIAVLPQGSLPSPAEAGKFFDCTEFDHILGRELWRHFPASANPVEAFSAFAEAAKKLLVSGGLVSLLESPPALGDRISRVLREECDAETALTEKLAEAEEFFFTSLKNPIKHVSSTGEQGDEASPPETKSHAGNGAVPRRIWNREQVEAAFAGAGFSVKITEIPQSEERLLTDRDLNNWFDSKKSAWGSFMYKALGEEIFLRIKDALSGKAKQGPVMWKWKSLLIKAQN